MKLEIIAEFGSIHDGLFGNAIKAIEVSARCGATAVKFQTHIADTETLETAPSPSYFKDETRIGYFKRTSFSKEQWGKLRECCHANSVDFISSPFSMEAVDLLRDIGCKAIKVASGEVTNTPLIRYIAKSMEKVYISSGMSSWEEIDDAMKVLKDVRSVIPMQCTSKYPCPPESVGLNILEEMRNRYKRGVGFSDHTTGSTASIAAVALGVVAVEKHVTFSRLMYGSDAGNGMEFEDFANFCSQLNDADLMRSRPVNKNNLDSLLEMKQIFEKSIVSRRAILAGSVLLESDLAYKKPGTGIPAKDFHQVVGKTTLRDIPSNKMIEWSDLI